MMDMIHFKNYDFMECDAMYFVLWYESWKPELWSEKQLPLLGCSNLNNGHC
jgi:hypothetical protein